MFYENIDYKNLDILLCADYYGLECKKSTENRYFANCCFHNERSPSLVFYAKSNTFHCFGCGANGNVANFVMKKENIEFKAALQVIRKIYELETSTSETKISKPPPPKRETKIELPKEISTNFDSVYSEILAYCATIPDPKAIDYLTNERCLNREILRKANIQTFETAKLQSYLKQKYSYTDLSNCGLSINLTNYQIVIPYYHNNKIANLQFRTIDKNHQPKYKFLYDKIRFNYNLDSLVFLENNEYCQTTRIGITEGVIDCLTVYQLCKDYELPKNFDCNEVLSLHSGKPNETEIKELLAKLQAKNLLVTFFIDNDKTSETGLKLKTSIDKVCKELNFKVDFFMPNGYKDVNEFYVNHKKFKSSQVA